MKHGRRFSQILQTALTAAVATSLLLAHALAQKGPDVSQAVKYKAPAGSLPALEHRNLNTPLPQAILIPVNAAFFWASSLKGG